LKRREKSRLLEGRIHVCHLITRLNPGGAQKAVFDLLSGLDRGRFTSSLVAGPGGALDDVARSLSGPSVHFADRLVRPLRPLHDLGAFKQCVALIRRMRPDIVHTHGPKAGVIGRWAAFTSGVPVRVHTFHGLHLYPSQPQAERTLIQVAERVTHPITSHVVAVSAHDQVAGSRLGFFRLRGSSVIRNGVDLTAFRRMSGAISPTVREQRRRELKEQLGMDPGVPLVTMMGYLRAIKAPERFLRLARLVSEVAPAVRFWLVGDGELRARLERLRRTLHLDGALELPGNRLDIPEIWGATDVAVLTSHSEGLPRSLIEAMASGVPVVASDLPGIREIVRHAVNGYLEGPGRVAAMANRVTELLMDPAKAARMGQRAVRTVGALDVQTMVKQHEALYQRLWESHRSVRRNG
jgi:glycosyltransferase involved in cell wall biosynthesis